MNESHIIETLRVHTQRTLDETKTHAERNRLGQFATPPRLALEILRQTRTIVGEKSKIRFLDPAFGTGAFYSALIHAFPSNRIQSAGGYEIDRHYGDEARKLWKNSELSLRIADFFTVPIPGEDGKKANLIVCNPPYVRHHHIPGIQKDQLSKLTARTAGLKVNGLSGLYCYFLIHAHNWLAEEGIGCWLIPTEFMDVNYGAVVKEYLRRKVTLLRIHRFDPIESQFDDALVSSAVVWFKKTIPPADHRAQFTFGGTFEAPHLTKNVSMSELVQAPKWTRLANGYVANRNTGAKLSDLFVVKRGLATGANDFFILTPEEIKKYALPARFLIPILPSPRYLKQDIVEADKRGNPKLEESLFLLSCNLTLQQVKREYSSLWRYFESGVEQKIHERYICMHRTPWYVQEDRPASPFLCTYMGRHSSSKGGPFRFILNQSRATAANVYLFLYPKPRLKALLEQQPELVKRIWEGLGAISSESLVSEGRVYGGGLHKMEPRELANAPAEAILQAIPELRLSNPPSDIQAAFI